MAVGLPSEPALSPVAGVRIGAAELAAGTETAITRHFTTEARPKALPPQPLQEIGANAVLRWKEWRARRE